MNNDCAHAERVAALAVHALPAAEVAGVEDHVRTCAACARELEQLRAVVDSFAAWPTDVLRPRASVQERLARRIAAEAGGGAAVPPSARWQEPDWKEVAPGISCKLLASDTQRDIVSMLVRLAPGAHYPAHTHSGVEELHLLDGELWIDERKLYPGDYNRGEPGASDKLVWSETGCTCVLITSTKDVLA
jgi:anti-sigma factor ChrR (cupin superfamily)